MLSCDVCGRQVAQGSGYCLSTGQVTTVPEYWRLRLLCNPQQVALIGADGAHLAAFAVETSASLTVWLVCDGCFGMFGVDRERARALFLELSRHPSGFRGDKPLGPGDAEAAIAAARKGSRKAFGRDPKAQVPDLALEIAMAMHGFARAKFDRPQ